MRVWAVSGLVAIFTTLVSLFWEAMGFTGPIADAVRIVGNIAGKFILAAGAFEMGKELWGVAVAARKHILAKRAERRLQRILDQLTKVPPTPAEKAVRRANLTFEVLDAVFPRRFTNEILGDTLERVEQMAAKGKSPRLIYLATVSSAFFVLLNFAVDLATKVVPLLRRK